MCANRLRWICCGVICLMCVTIPLGCSSGSKNIDPQKLSAIQKGKTTEADLVKLFGDPQGRFTDPQGVQHLTWMHADTSRTILAGVGVPFLQPTPDTQSLHVTMGADGTVVDYATGETHPGSTWMGN